MEININITIAYNVGFYSLTDKIPYLIKILYSLYLVILMWRETWHRYFVEYSSLHSHVIYVTSDIYMKALLTVVTGQLQFQ